MTAELLDEGPDDVETVVISWLSSLRRAANTRRAGDPVPFTLVEHVAGPECVEESYADPVVSVHTLCAKSLGMENARDEKDATHKRMLLLSRYLEDVELSGGRKASIDYVSVFMMPRREPYGDDQIIRYVARYQLGLSYA